MNRWPRVSDRLGSGRRTATGPPVVSWLAVAWLGILAALSCGTDRPVPDDAPLPQPATAGQAELADAEEADPDRIEGEPFVGDHLVRESWTGDLDGMLERRRIRALVVYSKTFYFYDKGRARGLAVEGLAEFEATLNRKLKLGPGRHVSVLFIPVSRDRLIPSLVEGLGDIAASNLTITPERLELVDFSVPVASGVKEIVVAGPGAPEIRHPDDLSGKEVYVRRSSSYYETLVRLDSRLRSQGKPGVVIRESDENLEDEDILEMVNAGLVGLTIVDSHKATLWSEIFPNIEPLADVAISEGNSIGWAFRKGSPLLAGAVNEFVETHRQGTAFGNTVLRRYLQQAKWVRNATSEQELAKRQAILAHIQKYAAEYDFDWLMVGAQAYQESGLDPNARSAAGAVGIMQVMPSTAGSPPISVEHVDRNVENNIHAGVKILRHYRDHYFDDPELDEVNRTLLCFAAYNAGPNRINRLRQRAAQQGLDPNVWFKNVELVVAKSVGRETVQYVSNVYKYYVAYKLAAEAMERSPAAKPAAGG